MLDARPRKSPAASLCAVWLLSAATVLSTTAQAQAPRFVHRASFSLDAPMDLYLSEDISACDHQNQSVRVRDLRTLAIHLYPDAYCSLVSAARCHYTFAADDAHAAGAPEPHMPRSRFVAVWDRACIEGARRLPDVVGGSIALSDASDLGVQGTYELTLADGTHLRGVFDSAPCPRPPSTRLRCL